MTTRTIQNDESGFRKPSNLEVLKKIADAMATITEYLPGSTGSNVIEAYEKGSIQAAQDIQVLIGRAAGLFARGKLNDDSLDGAMRA